MANDEPTFCAKIRGPHFAVVATPLMSLARIWVRDWPLLTGVRFKVRTLVGDWLPLLVGHSSEKNFPEVSEGPHKVITPNKNQSGFRKMVDNSTRLSEPAKISSLSPKEWTIFPCNPTLDSSPCYPDARLSLPCLPDTLTSLSLFSDT